MLDVHPPHTAVHGWRDFVLHIATITIGLLIAIGLEQTVEWLHHRHLVREARENIRREMEANEHTADQNEHAMQDGADLMLANVHIARGLRDHPGAPPLGPIRFDLTWSNYTQSAWQSARDTGALAYMPPAEVQMDADIYEQQAIVNERAVWVYTHQSELAAPLLLEDNPKKMDPANATHVMLQCATNYTDLLTIKQLTAELQKQYAERLAKA